MELPDQFQHLIINPPKVKVDHIVEDGDEIPFCGGIRVIFTPGHTPGHICLYLQESNILIAGDALSIDRGELRGPTTPTIADVPLAQQSLRALLDFNIEKMVCFHGGLSTENVNKQLISLINNF